VLLLHGASRLLGWIGVWFVLPYARGPRAVSLPPGAADG